MDRKSIVEQTRFGAKGLGPESWRVHAACAQTDPEAFFPERGSSAAQARRICLSCNVRRQCLDYALQHTERFGVWGGLTPRERWRHGERSA